MNDIRCGRYCVSNLQAHLVFVTKYKRGVLNEQAIKYCSRIFKKVCNDFESTLVACDGEDDHVHLTVSYPPKIALAKLVNSLKGVSSRLLRGDMPSIEKRYWKGVLWSPSYFATSNSNTALDEIQQYVENQREESINEYST